MSALTALSWSAPAALRPPLAVPGPDAEDAVVGAPAGAGTVASGGTAGPAAAAGGASAPVAAGPVADGPVADGRAAAAAPSPADAARAVQQLQAAVSTALGVLDGVSAVLRRMRAAALDAAGEEEPLDAAVRPVGAGAALPSRAVPGFVLVRPPGGGAEAVAVPGADAAAVDLGDWRPSDVDAVGRVDAALAQVLAGRVALASVLAGAEHRVGTASSVTGRDGGTAQPLDGDAVAAAREQLLAGRRRLDAPAGVPVGGRGGADEAYGAAAAREAYERAARREHDEHERAVEDRRRRDLRADDLERVQRSSAPERQERGAFTGLQRTLAAPGSWAT